MKLMVYSGEVFERGKWRYLIFGTVITVVVVVSALYGNVQGAIILLFLVGGYLFYSVTNHQPTEMEVQPEGLRMGKKIFARKDVAGFVGEINQKTNTFHNIVILLQNGSKLVHTVKDENANIKQFILTLNEHIPLISEYEQSAFDKIIRGLKL